MFITSIPAPLYTRNTTVDAQAETRENEPWVIQTTISQYLDSLSCEKAPYGARLRTFDSEISDVMSTVYFNKNWRLDLAVYPSLP